MSRSTTEILDDLETDSVLRQVRFDHDPLIDDLVARTGGEVFGRYGNDDSLTTTYRWLNGGAGALDAELVQRLARASGRSTGEIGGHGPKYLILMVASSPALAQ